MNFSTSFHHFFISLFVFHDLKNPEMSLERHQIWGKSMFCQNHQKSTNGCFCDDSIIRSLVVILKYVVCHFYDCVTLFDEMTNILNSKKKTINRNDCWKFCFWIAPSERNIFFSNISEGLKNVWFDAFFLKNKKLNFFFSNSKYCFKKSCTTIKSIDNVL